MRDSRNGLARWQVIGRLLPREVRTRVFDPAFADLLSAHLKRSPGRSLPFGLLSLGTLLGCVPMALVQLLVKHGRLTRLGKGLVWTASAVAAAWIVLLRVASSYAAIPQS